MAYNRCELNAGACGVSVTRLPNVRINGKVYYTLAVISNVDASAWYTALLDPSTYLPYAYGFQAYRIFMDNYTRDVSGIVYPRYWRHEALWSDDIVDDVHLGRP